MDGRRRGGMRMVSPRPRAPMMERGWDTADAAGDQLTVMPMKGLTWVPLAIVARLSAWM